MKLELGGGRTPHRKASGFLNVDVLDAPEVDVRLDLDGPVVLPWADDEVAAVYSSHCLEHLTDYQPLLAELCRVCRVGATLEIRVPHWLHDCAGIVRHKSVVTERWVRRWPLYGYGVGHGKRLELRAVHYESEEELEELRPFFGGKLGMTDEQIKRFVPKACHEVKFTLEVIREG